MRNARLVGILPLLFPAVLLTACEEPPPVEPIRPVLATKVGDVEGLRSNRFPGRAKATEETNLSFRVRGPLITRAVSVGDRVEAGDLIARIDPTDYEVARLDLVTHVHGACDQGAEHTEGQVGLFGGLGPAGEAVAL